MNSDIRVSTTFFFHRKTRKLQISLKEHGVLCLLKLWARVAVEKPCGTLSGWDLEDIEIEAEFKGKPGTFVSELLKNGFLDEKDGTYSLHNWGTRQGWVSTSTLRGDKARLSRMARTHNDIYNKITGLGYKSISRKEYESLTNGQRPLTTVNESQLTPAPSPDPSPKRTNEKITSFKKNEGQKKEDFYLTKNKKKLSGKRLETFLQFWDAFDYKSGKAEATDVWLAIPKLTDVIVDKIIAAAKTEAKNRPALKVNGTTPKMAQGWLSGRRWEDEIVEKKTPSQILTKEAIDKLNE